MFARAECLRRWRARAHVTDVLGNRIPRDLLDACTVRDEQGIANAVHRALKNGVDLPREIRGAYAVLREARGKVDIAAAMASLADQACAAFSGCTAMDELTIPDEPTGTGG